tara:strand:- start:1428 stop:1910 length:483 start_codon:yes stop_codon:yes gene_type:complete
MIKEIYIKRLLRHTKEGQGFYCSQVYQINEGMLSKKPLAPLSRMGNPLFILERQKVAIPIGRYPLGADFTGTHQWVKILDVPKRFNIEIHAGNYLRNTNGCPLLGQNYDENKQYSNEDIIINESQNSCDWFKFDFLLNDENKKQTKKVKQDEVIGHLTIT